MVDGDPAVPEVEPVARLLGLGKPGDSRQFPWPDYCSYGFTAQHIPALIRVATDASLILLPDESDPRAWAPVHAWRALGQLRAEAAVQPLMRLFHEVQDNDWVIEEMPDVFALIGPTAFPALAAYLRDFSHPAHSRLVAANSLAHIARAHPQVRDLTVQALAEQLSAFKNNLPGVNSVLIANLVDLQAAEQADLIHKVFTDGKVDRFLVGDWRDIRYRLRPPASKKSPTVPVDAPRSAAADAPARPAYQEPRTTPRGGFDR